MIVDSSALVAILRGEPDAGAYALALANAERPKMSAANWLETAIVVDAARNPVTSRRFDELIAEAQIELVPVTVDHVARARQAYRDFGKGSSSRARLNFGDCLAYALAAASREPLLFKGDDFVHTDLTRAEVPRA